ncbi:hypothetical protein L484_006220 [Morus notabilis]|uniref:Uncharacterized protein n=1 Tax=Morus notabilis TaxID=981085 RepID=W9RHH1_9ROSA|nr:hypothetical protein L484_006220 [Morus notabilis]
MGEQAGVLEAGEDVVGDLRREPDASLVASGSRAMSRAATGVEDMILHIRWVSNVNCVRNWVMGSLRTIGDAKARSQRRVTAVERDDGARGSSQKGWA